MKDTAPIGMGIAAVAALFGIIAAGVAIVLYDYQWIGGIFIGAIVAAVAAIVLALGWRSPQPGPQGVSAPTPQPMPTPQPAPTPQADPEPEVSSDPEPEVSVEPEPAPEPAPEPETPAPAPVTDAPAANAGQPAFLSAAREGGPDDLKQIKGVGKKLEETLHGMGIYHFDQIAEWGPAEQAWMDDNLKGFKGRATRDNWVEQAKVLAAGGETEFSGKVKKGDVY